MSIKSISENTPITVGVLTGLLVAVAWGGVTVGRITADVETLKATSAATSNALTQITQLTASHEARLLAQEKRP